MDIDRQRIAAVRMLQSIGYTYCDGEWLQPAATATPRSSLADADADAMHVELMRRADGLAGCTPTQRWQLGKDPNVPGGKG